VNHRAVFDELAKLGAISDADAQKSIDRLDALEKTKPTGGQVARYGALGAGAGALGHVVARSIEGAPFGRRSALGAAASGAIGMGAVPLIRGALDRRSEKGTLRDYMTQEHIGEYGPSMAAATDAQPPAGLSRSGAGLDKTAAEKEKKKSLGERSPNLAQFGKALGANIGAGLATQGLGGLAVSQGHVARPGDEALMEHLERTAPVKVLRPDEPVAGGAHFSPGSHTALGANAGGPAEPHVKVPRSMNNPAMLAHELGHADINRFRAGRLVQNAATAAAGGPLGGALGSAAGFASGFSDDPRVRRAGVLAPLVTSAPTLAYEAVASLAGLRRLRRGGANLGQLANASKALLPAWGSYAGRGGTQVAGAYGSQAVGSAIHDLDKSRAAKGTHARVDT
jgi:hypothetical protein